MERANKRKKIPVWILMVIALLISVAAVWAQNEDLFSLGDVSLVRIGTRVYTSGENIIQEPIFAIRIGDTSQAEAQAAFWDRFFAEYALNATLYVRAERGRNEIWRQMTYRRPASPEEAAEFFSNPPQSYKQFYSEKPVKFGELPIPVNQLEPAELSRIDFIMVYLVGGTKIYPVDGTTFEEAEALTRKIAGLLGK